MDNLDLISTLTLLGSICLLLYGMKLMSESVQKLVGDRLREMVAALTSNRSGKSAGLFSLAESAAVVLGIGSLANSWIITLFGFHLHLALYAMPLLAFSLPLFNSRNSDRHSWGELITGFSLLFVGIASLQASMPMPSADPLSAHVWVIGAALLLLVFVSTNATLVMALILVGTGWTPLLWGGVLVLLANVCTRRVPIYAALLSSLLSISALLFIDRFEPWVALPLLQTVACVGNVFIMFLFTRPWKQRQLSRQIDNSQQPFQLEFIEEGAAASGEMALLQVQKEVQRYADETYMMFSHLKTMLTESLGSDRQMDLYARIKQMESESDDAEEEIADFLNTISLKTLSADSELLSRRYYKIVDELESVADSIYHMACNLKNKADQRVRFTPQLNSNLHQMVELTDASLQHMIRCLGREEMSEAALNKGYNLEDEINNLRNQLRNNLIEMTDSGQIKFIQGTFYLDLINECERIGDYVMNILAASSEE